MAPGYLLCGMGVDYRLAGEFLAGGAPLNFIAKTRPGPNSAMVGYASAELRYLAGCCAVQPAPRYPGSPGQRTRVTRVSRRRLQPVSPPGLPRTEPRHAHPTFQAPWRHHFRATCVQTIAIVTAFPPPSYHSRTTFWATAPQGSRHLSTNTPHSLSEDVPAALSSISNQPGPGTKAQ